MKRFVLLALLVAATGAQATYLIGRSGSVVKPYQFYGWINGSYSKLEKAYNWDDSRYENQAENDKLTTTGAEVTAAVGLPGHFELGLTAPVLQKKSGQPGIDASTGVGDVMVHARYGILQSSLLPVKLAATLGVNLPTAKKTPIALGDRTVDVGLGLALVTTKLGKFTGHGRAAYWLNGKTDDTTKVGNTLEYLLCGDYAVNKWFTPELAVSGTVTGRKQVNGADVTHSESGIHSAGVLLMFKPIPQLVVRPKVSFPLAFISQGSKIADYAPGLDVWVTLP